MGFAIYDLRFTSRRRKAFTLVEMLVVIAIIGILAALLLTALPAVQQKGVRNRVTTELKAVETAINSYKNKKGFLPPDNPKDPSVPPLFYELTGALQVGNNNNQPSYQSIVASSDPPLTMAQLQGTFGIDGFLNAAPERSEVDNFFRTLLPRQYRDISPGIKVLVAPGNDQNGKNAVWNYNKTNPSKNAGAGNYDLWVDIYFAGKKVTIGNWKD